MTFPTTRTILTLRLTVCSSLFFLFKLSLTSCLCTHASDNDSDDIDLELESVTSDDDSNSPLTPVDSRIIVSKRKASEEEEDQKDAIKRTRLVVLICTQATRLNGPYQDGRGRRTKGQARCYLG